MFRFEPFVRVVLPRPGRALALGFPCLAITALLVLPAVAASLTFGDFALESGSDKQPGAIYRYDDVTTGVDALVSIDAFSAGASISTFDDPSSPSSQGKYEYFQPSINGTASDGDYADFTFTFVVADTSTSTTVTDFLLRAHDLDGNNVDGNTYEFLILNDFDSYTIDNPTNIDPTILTPSPVSVKFTSILNGGPPGITLDPEYAVEVDYTDMSSFSLRLGLEGTRTSSQGRQYALNMFDSPISFVDPQTTPVPEPGAPILLLAAAVAAVSRRPRRPLHFHEKASPLSTIHSLGLVSRLKQQARGVLPRGRRSRTERVVSVALSCLAITALLTLPAGAESLTFGDFSLESGTDKQAGAVYRYDDVTSGVDALVSIDALSAGASISTFDDPSSPTSQGKYEYFQPFINGIASDNDYADFTFSFVLADTSTSTMISDFLLRAHDVDGTNISGNIYEFLILNDFNSYTIDNPTNIDPTILTPSPVSVKFTSILNGGPSGITLDPEYAVEVDYTDTSSFSLRLGSEGTKTLPENRQFALNMFDSPIPFVDPQTTPVPEPSAAVLLLAAGMAAVARRPSR